MDPTALQVLSSPVTVIVGVLSAAGGGIFAALVGVRQLRHSISAQAEGLRAQARATELEAFTSFNMKFLDIAGNFEEHINYEDTGEQQLSTVEKRAIDRYFYLASMEFTLHREKIVNEQLSSQWLRGIKSTAKKKAFVERWNSTAQKFTLDEEFRRFFESNISPPLGS